VGGEKPLTRCFFDKRKMPETVTVRKGSYIHVKSTGELTLKEYKKTLAKIIEIFKETGINKVLVDTLEQTKTPSVLETMIGAEDLILHAPRTLVAIVSKDKHDSDRAFFRNVANNRGGIVKLFLDEKSALDWLFK
jgi:hypothetical protein